jgi:hypothetical protein
MVREPPPTVHRREQVTDVDELGLELDEQDRPARRVPGDEVDDTALAEVAEGHLRTDLPTRGLEPPGYLLGHSRMTRREEVEKLPASPPEDDVDPKLERAPDPPKRAERHVSRPAFDQRDRRRRDPGPLRHVRLSPPQAMAKAADSPPDLELIHRPDRDRGRSSAAHRRRTLRSCLILLS